MPFEKGNKIGQVIQKGSKNKATDLQKQELQ